MLLILGFYLTLIFSLSRKISLICEVKATKDNITSLFDGGEGIIVKGSGGATRQNGCAIKIIMRKRTNRKSNIKGQSLKTI